MSKVIVALNTSRRMGDCIAYAKFIAQRLATEPVYFSRVRSVTKEGVGNRSQVLSVLVG